jgi:hypothetical protein
MDLLEALQTPAPLYPARAAWRLSQLALLHHQK